MRLYLLLAGALLGALATAHYYDAKRVRAELKQAHAQQENNEAIQRLSNEYYKLYTSVNDRPNPLSFDRVRVEAVCDKTDATGMDNRADTARVELAPRVTRRIERVADKHAKQYDGCTIKLAACVDAYNSL